MEKMMKIDDVEGIGPAFAAKLVAADIRTVEALLKAGATAKGRNALAEKSGISAALILEWTNHADLYRIKGVGQEYSDLLEEAGVDTVVELSKRVPANLYKKMLEVNEAKQLVRRPPSEKMVASWVTHAKELPRVVSY
jgi:predicted flap endonuclease-1-like 5' DNA nuclease